MADEGGLSPAGSAPVMESVRSRMGALDATIVMVALTAAYFMKSFYSSASADDLGWVLRPTAGIVQAVTGSTFVAETGEGFLSRDLNLLIAPSCAGINFLIAAFCTGVLGTVHSTSTPAGKLLVLLGSAMGAFALTIVANVTRLLVGILRARLSMDWHYATEATLHRIEGVVIYFSFLCVGFLVARWLIDRRSLDSPAY